MIVVVLAGEKYDDYEMVWSALSRHHAKAVISNGKSKASQWARLWAEQNSAWHVSVHETGDVNQRMIDMANKLASTGDFGEAVIVAFHGEWGGGDFTMPGSMSIEFAGGK